MYDFQTKQREYSMTIIHICIAFGYCFYTRIHTALYIPDVLHSSNMSYLDTQVTTAGSANGWRNYIEIYLLLYAKFILHRV